MEKYVCKECGAEAHFENDKLIRSCEHTGTILLLIEVVTKGEGGLQ